VTELLLILLQRTKNDRPLEELLSAQSLVKKLRGDLEVATNKLHLLEQERSKEKEFS